MKKVFMRLAAICVAALAGMNVVNAQLQANSGKPEFEKTIKKEKEVITPDPLNDLEGINPKALKRFSGQYKDAVAVSWEKIRNGFVAQFVSNGIRNKIFYTPKGNWSGSVKTYTEEKMLNQTREIVKGKYYDYSIVLVEELEIPDSDGVPTYIIYVENKDDFKLIRMFDMEMEVWRQMVKRKS
ncbi:MAG: hypothetical protein ABI760_19325 [Ferruginibacter sp.]